MDRRYIDFGIAVTTPPAVEPVSRVEAKNNLRVDFTDDDDLIDRIITAAREWVEGRTGRQLITATLEYRVDRFGSQIALPRPPLQSVTSIKYIDTAGDEQTLATTEYEATETREPALIIPAYGKTWPATANHPEAVRVVYDAGYGDSAGDVPKAIRQAILLMVSHYYELRQPVITGMTSSPIQFSVESLLSKYVMHWSPA